MNTHKLISALAVTVSTTALFVAAANPAFAQDSAPQDAVAEEATGQDAIIVTGTRRTDRTVADSTVPVDIISAEALLNSGQTETNKLLNQLVPSFNFPQPSLTDGTDSLRPATLRGLAPDQVLVLVNGKRRHQSALVNLNGSVGRGSTAVDLNTIPPLAIERIEVLRDGAASQYGSDAIAGVINVQLKKGMGGRAQATFGKYITEMEDVGQVDTVSLTTGSSDNPTITYTGKDRKRNDGDTYTFASNFGLPLGESGYLNLTAEYKDRSPTNRSGPDIRRNYFAAGDPREATFNRYAHRYGDGVSKDLNFFVNAGYEFSDSAEFYTFGSYGVRDGNGAGFYRRSTDARNRDWAASTTSFVPIYADGFLPLIASNIVDISAAAGLRGATGGWDYDLSAVYGSNRLDYTIENTVNTSLGGVASARSFDSGGLRSGQTSINLDMRRDLDIGIGKSVSFAFGGEYRNENYKIVAGELQSYVNGPFSAAPFNAAGGAQVFPGFRPANETDVSRSSAAGYAELDADLTDQLTLQLAGRYEHFSDFGDTINGKAAARFEVIDGIALRGSVSTGFRAPSLAQQSFAATSTNNVGGVLIEIGTFPVSSPVAIALGAQPLKPEKSVNLGAGVTLTPFNGLSITADYYNIEISDRITLTENLQGADVLALLTTAGVTGVSSARFFINGIDTKTTGLDVVASYRVPDFGLGQFRVSVGYNLNNTKITDRRVFSGFTAQRLFARQESYRLTDGQPKNKLNVGLDWDYDNFGLTLRTNRYGEVFLPSGFSTSANNNNIALAPGDVPGDIFLSPKWVTDIEFRFKPVESVSVAFGANNLLDTYPDRLPFGTVNGVSYGFNNSFLPYSSQSPFGFSGRFLYGRVSIDF
ncbi:MAG: TonB-dependent receptor [Sphingorhabdus sp.]|uniref:TonB-dependent receptor plug domain-containing protein n=1 Tax=Sphingorhabdus sp. TaxID=1902408 RepID=UPI0025FFE77A|nr:TonB-dependent receptor [Sphingorhabdus sp.]MCO4092896.1 TonB-dependent receptor [Sphingorhabdus sp.]